ncbi:MAG: YkgJ family cysteine cluster protein [Desulfobulbaceae bacterium]|nr:YkgJ family cysteine cluster protein [Desulfobulbaceae bacterium]
MDTSRFDEDALKTILHECKQCGTCCKDYRKIVLHPDEVDFIKKMGGYVGANVSMSDIREKGLAAATEEATREGKVFMIHPDDKGCVFLEHRNDKYYCRIYHYRPRTCQGFRCNLADNSFLELFGGDSAIHLLGQDS